MSATTAPWRAHTGTGTHAHEASSRPRSRIRAPHANPCHGGAYATRPVAFPTLRRLSRLACCPRPQMPMPHLSASWPPAMRPGRSRRAWSGRRWRSGRGCSSPSTAPWGGYVYVLQAVPGSKRVELLFPNRADTRNRIEPGASLATAAQGLALARLPRRWASAVRWWWSRARSGASRRPWTIRCRA